MGTLGETHPRRLLGLCSLGSWGCKSESARGFLGEGRAENILSLCLMTCRHSGTLFGHAHGVGGNVRSLSCHSPAPVAHTHTRAHTRTCTRHAHTHHHPYASS